MEVINLTPHTLNVHDEEGNVHTFEPSGEVARVEVKYAKIREVAGLPCYEAYYGEAVGVPAPEEGKIYIVSGMVEAACKNADVYAPGEHLRDASGKPIGCKGLKQTS